ncbi:MAG: hypothetical protein HY791_04815 [Deltaproteobacteria bacterium]|nr:hypothetical protein [Deltaproteobacteria bacterium]
MAQAPSAPGDPIHGSTEPIVPEGQAAGPRPSEPPRKTRGRTSALKLIPRAAIVAQMKKPGAKQALKSVLDAEGPKLVLLAQAERAGEPGAREGLETAAQELVAALAAAMKSAKMPRPEQSLLHLQTAGLQTLLARALGRGQLGYGAVADQLERMRQGLARREKTARELELGILALDELAQRIALVSGRGGFTYPTEANRARDSLITFARSLHR